MIDYSYLRVNKAKELKLKYETAMHLKTSLGCQKYQNASILPLRERPGYGLAWGLGGVVDQNNIFIKESAIDKYYDYGYVPENISVKYEKVVYCGYLRRHWGHFLIDCTNRLWYFLLHPDMKFVYFIEEDNEETIAGNYKEFFELLGIWDRLEFVNKPTQFDEVIIPEVSFDRRKNFYSQLFLDVFDTVSKHALEKNRDNVQYSDKVFFTRGQLLKARKMEIGMPLIDSFFRNNGYSIVAPEKISLAEMICMIRNAKFVASYSGTLPHNMLFGYEHQAVIIIERNALNNENQHYIGNMKHLNTTHIDANYSIYPVELAYGPFIYGFSDCLKRFAADKNYRLPDQSFLTDSYNKRVFREYMNAYRNEHYLQWYMGGNQVNPWMTYEIRLLYEAYQESAEAFKPWINGTEPYCWQQHFSLRFIKRKVKSVISACGGLFRK